MIEQPARVAAARRRTVWVSSCLTTDCDACAAGKGCGAVWLLRCFGTRAGQPLALPHDGSLAVGDRVILSIPERWLLLVSSTVYGAPLAGLLLGAVLGDSLASDAGALILGSTGLAMGLVLARALSTGLVKSCPLSVQSVIREPEHIR